jgi:hypothetical protein
MTGIFLTDKVLTHVYIGPSVYFEHIFDAIKSTDILCPKGTPFLECLFGGNGEFRKSLIEFITFYWGVFRKNLIDYVSKVNGKPAVTKKGGRWIKYVSLLNFYLRVLSLRCRVSCLLFMDTHLLAKVYIPSKSSYTSYPTS